MFSFYWDRRAFSGYRPEKLTKTGPSLSRNEDCSFQFDCLLPGKYTLQLMGANDETSAAGTTDRPQVLRQYKAPKLAVVVGAQDVLLDDIVLTALKPGEPVEYPR
jgi:hypothetical protein